MVKVISQETFDAVVQENITEFDLSKEEAIKDAISQFESQVGISNESKYILPLSMYTLHAYLVDLSIYDLTGFKIAES